MLPARSQLVCFGFLCAAASVLVPSGGTAQAVEGRPVILLLHGRNQQGKTNGQLQSEWLPALRDGLRRIAFNPIGEADVRMVFYQDVYGGPQPPEATLCPADAAENRDRLDPLRTESDTAVAAEEQLRAEVGALRSDVRVLTGQMSNRGGARAMPVPDPEEFNAKRLALSDASARLETASARARRASDALLAESEMIASERRQRKDDRASFLRDWTSRVRAAVAKALGNDVAKIEAAMKLFFYDTYQYVSDERFGCATDARVAKALMESLEGKRPVVLLAHSMGTFVTFNLLFEDDRVAKRKGRRPDYELASFITVGSQLAIEPLMEAVIGKQQTPYPVPRSINSWRNIRGERDWVAPEFILGRYQTQSLSPAYVEYGISTSSGKEHDIAEYLRNAVTARTLAARWCDAFRAPSTKPAECATLRDVPDLMTLPAGTRKRWP